MLEALSWKQEQIKNQNTENENDKWSEDYFWVTKEKTEKDYAIPSAFSAFTEYFDMKPGIGKKIHKWFPKKYLLW